MTLGVSQGREQTLPCVVAGEHGLLVGRPGGPNTISMQAGPGSSHPLKPPKDGGTADTGLRTSTLMGGGEMLSAGKEGPQTWSLGEHTSGPGLPSSGQQAPGGQGARLLQTGRSLPLGWFLCGGLAQWDLSSRSGHLPRMPSSGGAPATTLLSPSSVPGPCLQTSVGEQQVS